jgi:hypothetical protein
MTLEEERLALHDGPELLRWVACTLRMTRRPELNAPSGVSARVAGEFEGLPAGVGRELRISAGG